jgi:hypothetical protein
MDVERPKVVEIVHWCWRRSESARNWRSSALFGLPAWE